MIIPNQIDYIDTQRTVLSDRTDAYINENGRLIKIEQGYFYERFLRDQIEDYLKRLFEYRRHMGRYY